MDSVIQQPLFSGLQGEKLHLIQIQNAQCEMQGVGVLASEVGEIEKRWVSGCG